MVGTRTSVNTVDSAMPPSMTAPMPRYSSEPAPLEATSGRKPRILLAVMKIGRSRLVGALENGILRMHPLVHMVQGLLNQRIAALTTTPAIMMKPSIVTTSSFTVGSI